MKIRNKGFSFAVIPILAILAGCSSSVPLMQCNWQDKPVKVNGKATEWSVPLQYYDSKTKLNFTVTNDDTTLYYCFRITDDANELRVLRAGMQIWIDTTGKNQRQIGIEFPYSELTNGGEDKKKVRDSAAENKKGTDLGIPQKQIHLTGFKAPIAGIVPLPNNYGIKLSISRDSTGVVIYEASIPFRTFCKNTLTSADNKTFGFTIVLNPLITATSETAAERIRHHGGDVGGAEGGGGALGGDMSMHAAGLGGVSNGAGLSGDGSDDDDKDSRTDFAKTLKLKIHLAGK